MSENKPAPIPHAERIKKEAQAKAGTDFSPGTPGFGKPTSKPKVKKS